MLDLNISSNSGILPNLVPQKIIFTLNCKATINRSIVIPLLIDGKIIIIQHRMNIIAKSYINYIVFSFIIINKIIK